MTRLIDADALKEKLNEIFDTVEVVTFDDIITVIVNAPTVDTDLSEYSDKLWKEAYERGKNERPHGEWMKIEAPSYTIIRCTCCGYKDNAIYIPNYCPNCGADMKEVEE